MLTFSVKGWGANVALIQGVKWDGTDFYVYQADKVAGGEDLIIRRYDGKFNYKGFVRIPDAGHGSGTGVMRLSPTTSRHILPAGSRGIATVDYVIGNTATPKRTFYGAVGPCTSVSVNNAAGILSVRKGGSKQTVSWFKRDDILKGLNPKPIKVYSFKTPSLSVNNRVFGLTFQGHYNFNGSDYFHWETDLPPRGSTNYRSFAQQITAEPDGRVTIAKTDTTKWYPAGEPQGFLNYNGILHFVKRVGGLNQNRKIICVPMGANGTTKAV